MQTSCGIMPAASLLFSWEWINDDFKEEWLFLNKKMLKTPGKPSGRPG
jgi:hypothetical protein